MKIIETNISMFEKEIVDHQSRIIEVRSWEDYVSFYKDKKEIKFSNCSMLGFTNPEEIFPIEKIKYDNFHMRIDFQNGITTLAYSI